MDGVVIFCIWLGYVFVDWNETRCGLEVSFEDDLDDFSMKKKNHEKKQIVSKIVRFFRVFTFELVHSFSSPLYIIEV